MRCVTALTLPVLVGFGLACMSGSMPDDLVPVAPGAPAAVPAADAPLELRDDLERGCFGRPNQPFSPSNFAKDQAFVKKGDRAWEFELASTDGDVVRLSELLAERPVLLVQGNYTCPVYQKNRKRIDELAAIFADDIHVVLVYGPEAHPKTDPSPYRGDNWAKEDKFSHVDEPETFEERVEHALRLKGDRDLLTLVEPLDNPIWCTYATAPNGAFLIRQDGTFEAVHDWFDEKTMAESVAALVGFEGDLDDERLDDGKGDRREKRGKNRR